MVHSPNNIAGKNEAQKAIPVVLYLLSREISSRQELEEAMRKYYSTQKGEFYLGKDKLITAYETLLKVGEIEASPTFRRLLTLKATRSNSGIVVVSVLTKPYNCPGRCIYCPTEKNVPKSYLSQEPAVMRAIMMEYSPYLQVQNRLKSLKLTGHSIDKVNIRVIGGTFSFYESDYKEWFMKELYRACNDFESADSGERSMLLDEQNRNETAKVRVVETSVETRQDYINESELESFRRFGITKVELGVQSIYDDVLLLNQRGHDAEETVRATKLLREYGFKVAYQMMLNLPGSNFQRDLEMMKALFTDERFKPDHLKIYPLALVKEAKIYQMYLRGEYKPYNKEELTALLIEVKKDIPYYCRVERVIRDIPANYIVEGGAKASNLRQFVQEEMKKKGLTCNCIRCREAGAASLGRKDDIPQLFRMDYEASGAKEIFLSFESQDRKVLYSILRLRIDDRGFGMVREMHTYGEQVGVGEKGELGVTQHLGLGKKLLLEAEHILKEEFGILKIKVIAGIGVREYFLKRGYAESETYMVKDL